MENRAMREGLEFITGDIYKDCIALCNYDYSSCHI